MGKLLELKQTVTYLKKILNCQKTEPLAENRMKNEMNPRFFGAKNLFD